MAVCYRLRQPKLSPVSVMSMGCTVDWCSTSYAYDTSAPDDDDDAEDPLLCPHGYVCQLDSHDDGRDGETATPNRGRCVRKPPEPPPHGLYINVALLSPPSPDICSPSEITTADARDLNTAAVKCQHRPTVILLMKLTILFPVELWPTMDMFYSLSCRPSFHPL